MTQWGRVGGQSVSQWANEWVSPFLDYIATEVRFGASDWKSQSKNKSLQRTHLSPNCSPWTRRHRCCIEVKFTLEQAKEDQRSSRGISLLFLWLRHYMGVGGQRQVPAALPPGKTRYTLYRRLSGPTRRSGQTRKISPPPRLNSRTVQLVARRYTDWALPAHIVAA